MPVNLHPLIAGIGYMVYGEKLDTFDESRKDLLEYQDAAIEIISLLIMLQRGPPLYRYFPTKNYRRFTAAINRTIQYGVFMLILQLCLYSSKSKFFNVYKNSALKAYLFLHLVCTFHFYFIVCG